MLRMLDLAPSSMRKCYSGLLSETDHQHITKSPRLTWLSIQVPITQTVSNTYVPQHVAKARKRVLTTPNSTYYHEHKNISHLFPSPLFSPLPSTSVLLREPFNTEKCVFLIGGCDEIFASPRSPCLAFLVASEYARARFWALSPLAQIRPFHLN
jgi:hypothetical protein